MKKYFTKQTLIVCLIFTSAFVLSRPSEAYLALNETAELLPEGYYKFGLAPQLRTEDEGINVAGYFDYFIIDDLNGRVEIGGGKTPDFWALASLKFVPFPDIDRQPAMGVRAAIIHARENDASFYNVQIAPIISKLADTRYGRMIPYVALPITFQNGKGIQEAGGKVDKSITMTQFAVGAEWFSNENMHVGAELDLNLSNSATAGSIFLSFPFDSSIGYKK